MEFGVDDYDEYERDIRWEYQLKEQIQFTVTENCICKRDISTLRVKDDVEVMGMDPEDECEHEMFVIIRWGKEGLAVPLSQLQNFNVDSEKVQEVEEWH